MCHVRVIVASMLKIDNIINILNKILSKNNTLCRTFNTCFFLFKYNKSVNIQNYVLQLKHNNNKFAWKLVSINMK